MDRLTLTGLALVTAGAVGALSVELIGTAHASRAGDKTYFMAVSTGSGLRLLQQRSQAQSHLVPLASVGADTRRLTCARLIEVADVSLGFRCRSE